MSRRHHTKPVNKRILEQRINLKHIVDFQTKHNATDRVLELHFNNWYMGHALQQYYRQRDNLIK